MQLSPNKSLLALVAVVAAATLLVPACSSSEGSSSTEGAATELKVSGVWARQVMDMGALYMTITGGADADALTKVGVPSDVAAGAHLHETVVGDTATTAMGGSTGGSDAMSMDPVQKVDVPAGEVVTLKPGGFHVMLIGMKRQLQAGDTFDVTLTFENAGTKKVTATVKGL